MTNASSMTPGSRPRRGVIGVLALLGAGALTTAVVLAAGEAADPPQVAAAVDLATFSSCEDLADWGTDAMGGAGMSVDDSGEELAGGDVAMEDAAAPAPATTMAVASDSDGATQAAEGEAATVADETNVAVEGVDEIDLIDRLTEDVVLVASEGRLSVVDLAAAEVIDATEVPGLAQVTFDAEAGVAWVVGHRDTGGVVVERFAVDTEGLDSEGQWTTTGYLVDARRVGDELHVVASDGFLSTPTADVPFTDGPVPCDEVLHPEGPSDPSATLLVTLPATGDVEPVRAAEVVGSGSLVHVTTGAIYLATPQWGTEGSSTGIHRFDLATLEPTGSGSVEGQMLDEFSMSEHDGALRVAVTQDGGGFGIPIEGDVAVAPATTFPGTDPGADAVGEALNEIVVLDTDGALDEVGRTPAFGHPGETLHGIRFAGTTAYAVTFLQTDPFYVVDLADPTSPQVVGEVELPGFSSYLHPLGGGLVVGFGPGEVAGAEAKLFDVSDPAHPVVVDDLVLGDESAVAWDHHAYLDLGDGRFAVPTTSYDVGEALVADGGRRPSGGVAGGYLVVDTSGGQLDVEDGRSVVTQEPVSRVLTVGDGWALLAGSEISVLDAEGTPTGTILL